jgi:hypothetical protein
MIRRGLPLSQPDAQEGTVDVHIFESLKRMTLFLLYFSPVASRRRFCCRLPSLGAAQIIVGMDNVSERVAVSSRGKDKYPNPHLLSASYEVSSMQGNPY